LKGRKKSPLINLVGEQKATAEKKRQQNSFNERENAKDFYHVKHTQPFCWLPSTILHA
jgi:hypothetical protein